jgi:tetratricopeptide (TPR) repeat protein
MQHFANTLRALVATNRPKLVLAVLSDFLSKNIPHLHNEALMLQANLSQAERDLATGVANRNEVQQSLAKINAGLLHLIGEIAQHPGDEMAAIERAQEVDAAFHEQEFVPKPARNSTLLLSVSGLIVAVLLGFLIWKMMVPQAVVEKSAEVLPKPLDSPVVKSLAEQKTEYDAWIKIAEDCSKQGQWQKSLEALNKAFGLGFDNAKLFNLRAESYLHLERYTEARDDARIAITKDANDCFSFMSLAQALSKMGDEAGFYTNIEIALRKHCKVWEYTEQIGIFEHRNTLRFKKLISQYKQ